MKTSFLLLMSALAVPVLSIGADVPSKADQIALAILAAPAEWQAGAGVWGFDGSGKLIKLREATNNMVCFGDSPALEKISATCVSKDMEEWQVRIWELRSRGAPNVLRTVWSEADSGKLMTPPAAWPVNILEGSSFDATTGKVADYSLRWVVVMPNVTPEGLGLSAEKSPDKPWLMNPGTAGAHIMIPAVTRQP